MSPGQDYGLKMNGYNFGKANLPFFILLPFCMRSGLQGKNSAPLAATELQIRWMDDLQFYILFNSISVIPGRWESDNEGLCAKNPVLD